METKLTKVIELKDPEGLFTEAESLLNGAVDLLKMYAENSKNATDETRMYRVLNIIEGAKEKLNYYAELTYGG